MTATQEAVTPTVRAAFRRARFWIVVAVVAAVIALGTAVVNSSTSVGGEFDPANPGPEGARALRSVLEQQGVRVRVEGTVAAAAAAPGTLLVDAGDASLTDDAWARLLDGRRRVVVVSPDRTALDAVLPGTTAAGRPDRTTVAAGCDLPLARRAGSMSLTGVALGLRAPSATVCFSDAAGGAQLVAGAHDGVDVLLLADRSAFTNEHIRSAGNAAVALGALGPWADLVWFRQSPFDPAVAGPRSLQDLTPPWVTPLVVLLLAAGLAAALWRGRRLGAVVIEALPVVVRSRETVEGRARLYDRAAARLHAADALRIGAIRRIAPILGLSRRASVLEVIEAAARATGRPRQTVEAVLLGAEPGRDADLVHLSDDLTRLEAAVRTAVVPGSPSPSSPTTGDR